jgi:hypothetical protein
MKVEIYFSRNEGQSGVDDCWRTSIDDIGSIITDSKVMPGVRSESARFSKK